VQISWLDETVRAQLRSAPRIEEVAVVGSDVSILLDVSDAAAFRTALDLAVHLAKWSPQARQPYR